MTERSQRRIERIRHGGAYPQFGCAGRHRGNGSEECPRGLHHHHDDYCQTPTLYEWAAAGRTGPITLGSRA